MFDVVVDLKKGKKTVKKCVCLQEANRARIMYRRNKINAVIKPSPQG